MSLISLAGMLFLVFAQQPSQQPDWNQKIQERSFRGDGGALDYRMGPGDLLEISVFGVDKFLHQTRISASGFITVPYIGKVPAAGLTGAELEARLAEMLVENKLILNPQVLVFVKEYQSQPVLVMGAVKQPGQYMITRTLNLVDAIAIAGGIDQVRSSDYLLVQRRGKSDVMKIELKELLENVNPDANIVIQGGDVVQVPERLVQLFYVIGEVNRPGAYELPRDKGHLTMAQALGWAGGPLKTAKLKSGILIRYETDGSRKEIAVNLKDILNGRTPDLAVNADDVIFIPGSNVKTIGYGLLGAIPGAASSTFSGSIVYRNRY